MKDRKERMTMNQRFIWFGALLVIVELGVLIARGDSPVRYGWHRGGPFGHMARELNLNGTQKSQIKSVWQAEKPTVASLVKEFATENKEMDSAARQGAFDESKVQAIADRQAATLAQLIVEKEKLESKIYTTVLSPEQRTKTDKLQEQWHSCLDRIAERLAHENESGR